MTSRLRMTRLAVIATLMTGIAAPALAQMSADVKFSSGDYGTMLNGTITGQEYFDYKLGAKAGQEMFTKLDVTDSNGGGVIYFNILPPGSSGEAIYNSSVGGNTATTELPKTGTYIIRVYQMGNDASSGKTTGYTLDLSIQ